MSVTIEFSLGNMLRQTTSSERRNAVTATDIIIWLNLSSFDDPKCVSIDEYIFEKVDNHIVCSICCEKSTHDNVILDCKHSFHENCIKTWLKYNNSCPLCRCEVVRGPDIIMS